MLATAGQCFPKDPNPDLDDGQHDWLFSQTDDYLTNLFFEDKRMWQMDKIKDKDFSANGHRY